MAKRNDFEHIRQIRTRLNSVKDDALVNSSAKAMVSVKNVLHVSRGAAQTAAYHTVAQKYENLDAVLQRMNESMRFLGESRGDLKRDWEVLVGRDVGKVREALFALLSSCESLDKDGSAKRVMSESQNLGKIMDEMEKIKNNAPKSCEAFAKLSNEFELSLRNLDSVLGATSYPAEFDDYSKFSSDLEDLGEQIKRLNESLKFFEDEHTRGDWKHFMELDLNRVKESIKTSYSSSMQLVDVVAQK